MRLCAQLLANVAEPLQPKVRSLLCPPRHPQIYLLLVLPRHQGPRSLVRERVFVQSSACACTHSLDQLAVPVRLYVQFLANINEPL